MVFGIETLFVLLQNIFNNHLPSIFIELGIIIILATILGSLARILRQPLILAYIIAGVILGPAVLNMVSAGESIETLSTVGVAFLLFLVGLNLNTVVLREVGKVALVTGISQVGFTALVGYFIATALGFSSISSIYIAIALTFSSTIIIVKILSDKKDLNSLYGKISVGFLLVQDVIAIFILIFLTGLGSGGSSIISVLPITIVKAGVLIGVALLSGKIITPFVFPRAAKLSQELLFIAAIAWMFLLSIIAILLGLSVEIGAFLAGVGLASLPFVQDLHSKIKNLRDFFIVLFFIHLGTSISLASIQSVIIPAIILSLFVLIGNPLIVMVLMRFFGYTKRTGLFTGLTVSQISEFSLIIVAIGFATNQISAEIVGLVTLVGIITITISTYMITYNQKIYDIIKNWLNIFEKKGVKKKISNVKDRKYDYVFIGAHRIVGRLMELLPESQKKKILLIDYDPTTLKSWKKKGIDVLYGDIEDEDIMDKIIDIKPKVILSSVPDPNDNIKAIKILKPYGLSYIGTALRLDNALWLYENGADYVIVPHLLGGEKANEILQMFDNKRQLNKIRKEHVKNIKKIME